MVTFHLAPNRARPALRLSGCALVTEFHAFFISVVSGNRSEAWKDVIPCRWKPSLDSYPRLGGTARVQTGLKDIPDLGEHPLDCGGISS